MYRHPLDHETPPCRFTYHWPAVVVRPTGVVIADYVRVIYLGADRWLNMPEVAKPEVLLDFEEGAAHVHTSSYAAKKKSGHVTYQLQEALRQACALAEELGAPAIRVAAAVSCFYPEPAPSGVEALPTDSAYEHARLVKIAANAHELKRIGLMDSDTVRIADLAVQESALRLASPTAAKPAAAASGSGQPPSKKDVGSHSSAGRATRASSTAAADGSEMAPAAADGNGGSKRKRPAAPADDERAPAPGDGSSRRRGR